MRNPAIATFACIFFLAACAASLMPPTARTYDQPESVLLRAENVFRAYTGEVVGIGGGDDPDVMGETCRLSREFGQEMLDRIAGTPVGPWSGR